MAFVIVNIADFVYIIPMKTKHNMQVLQELAAKNGPLCVGLDTDPSYLPESVLKNFASPAQAVLAYNREIIRRVAADKSACCFKVQIAYYEAMGLEGFKVYAETLKLVRETGLIAISDIKRGDIGATSEAYARAHFTGDPKDLTMIMAAHDIPYVAQVSPHNWRDLISKCEKGFECGGPAFINAVSPCPRGWRFASDDTINMAKLSVETCVWPLYEVENGKYNLTAESLKIANGVLEKKPVEEWFKAQGRYKHMLKPENADLVKQVQEEIDRKWDRLLKLSKL